MIYRCFWSLIYIYIYIGKQLTIWNEYQQIEQICSGIQAARKILQRAAHYVRDYPEVAMRQYREFEMCHGTLPDTDEAFRRCRNTNRQLTPGVSKVCLNCFVDQGDNNGCQSLPRITFFIFCMK